jgi:hypothetical protein
MIENGAVVNRFMQGVHGWLGDWVIVVNILGPISGIMSFIFSV